jgi:hypothetical protein
MTTRIAASMLAFAAAVAVGALAPPASEAQPVSGSSEPKTQERRQCTAHGKTYEPGQTIRVTVELTDEDGNVYAKQETTHICQDDGTWATVKERRLSPTKPQAHRVGAITGSRR